VDKDLPLCPNPGLEKLQPWEEELHMAEDAQRKEVRIAVAADVIKKSIIHF
jgi:hypothetical protein